MGGGGGLKFSIYPRQFVARNTNSQKSLDKPLLLFSRAEIQKWSEEKYYFIFKPLHLLLHIEMDNQLKIMHNINDTVNQSKYMKY